MGSQRAIIVRMWSVLLAAPLLACAASEQQVADIAAQAQQLLDSGQPGQAQELIGRAVRERDDLPGVFLVQARIALALGKRTDAYRAFANVLALEATNPEALMGLAQTGMGSGHLKEADEAADKILALDPNQTDAMLIKGIGKMVRNDLDGAIAFSDRILALKPSDMAAIILKSRALALQGDRAAALKLVETGIAKQGPTLELTMALAELQRRNGDASAFLASLRRIRELAPANRDYRFDLVDTLYRLGRIDEARVETASLIAEPNEDTREATRYARLWYAYDQAALTPDQLAQAAAKASVDTRLALARFYVATGRGAVAAALLRPIATGWSSDVQATYARAVASAGPAGGSAAVTARDAAIRILDSDADNGAALLVRADATLARNDPSTAIIDYQRVIRDYPEWEEGYLGLARAYAAANKPEGVRRAFESGRQAMPQSLPLARAYVMQLLRTGDKAHAIEVARRFGLDSPSLIVGWAWYGTVCAQAGGGDCRTEAADGLKRARAQFGLDLAPGTPPPVALIGRLN